MLIEATRRSTKAAVTRIREAFLEFDRIVFKDVDVPAETAYSVIRDGRTWVLALNDPSVGAVYLPEREDDCGAIEWDCGD